MGSFLDGIQNYSQEFYADRPLPDSMQVPAGVDPNREEQDPFTVTSLWGDNPDVDGPADGLDQSAANAGRMIEDTARWSIGLEPNPGADGNPDWIGRLIKAIMAFGAIYIVGQLFTFTFHIGDGE